ncbi:MAG: methionine synthase [Canidatus Methanoxibalbensis ujae]|nr:methionine synthase [Candidatus Methanoxibalbensis ujae]
MILRSAEEPVFDDVGSYPPPEGVSREHIQKALMESGEEVKAIVSDAMAQKISSGVELPNYPQFHDMISQYTDPLTDDARTEEPFLIRDEHARIPEVYLLEEFAAHYKKEKGEKLRIRICVTGPVELYYKMFEPPVYDDILRNIAISVQKFVRNAIENAKNFEIACVCIDEPSLGIDPRIERDECIIKALDIAAEFAFKRGIDTQIHLHSPIFYESALNTRTIGIIGIESAANPSFLDIIDRKSLESYDKFLRAGIARTDILRMAAEYDEKYHTDVFREKNLKKVIEEFNSADIIRKRLEKALSSFGERVKYIGPDCGLGTFPHQKLASLLLENTRKGIDAFRSGGAE